jgi:hypothetical protein
LSGAFLRAGEANQLHDVSKPDPHLLQPYRQEQGGYEKMRPPNGGLRSCGLNQNYHVTHLPPRQ